MPVAGLETRGRHSKPFPEAPFRSALRPAPLSWSIGADHRRIERVRVQDIGSAAEDRHLDWFIRAAAESFAFLTDLGFDQPAASLHFRGTVVTFRTDECSVDIELDPDTRNVEVSIGTSTPARDISRVSVWEVLAKRDPSRDWFPPPRQRGLPDHEVVSLLRLWGDGLRDLASDVVEPCRGR